MADENLIHLFVEDRAHEQFIAAALRRIAGEETVAISVQTILARGGRARVLEELRGYQTAVVRRGISRPAVLVVGVDANCQGEKYKRGINDSLDSELRAIAVVACPNPHIERWYLSDPVAFKDVVGIQPKVRKRKCGRDVYKQMLSQAIADAGEFSTLGGIEYASELVDALHPFDAGKKCPCLKHFWQEAKNALRRLKS